MPSRRRVDPRFERLLVRKRSAACSAALLLLGLLWLGACAERSAPTWTQAERTQCLEQLASTGRAEHRAAIERLGAWQQPDLEWLCAQLAHSNRGVREGIAHALGDLAPQDARVVAALRTAFEDSDDYVRWKAARALGNLGPIARPALPQLLQAAQAEQETEIVRAAAARAVQRIGN